MKLKVVNNYSLFIFIWFFLMTLNSYYFYDLGMPLFSVIGAILSTPLIFLFKVKIKKYMYLPFFVFVYIFFSSLITMFPNHEFSFISRIIFFILFLPIIIFSSYLINEKSLTFYKVLKITLVIHLFFFFFQFFNFYLFGNFIDFIMPITGVAQRALGGSYEINTSGDKLIRAAGLFNEPGTYSTFIFLILSVKKEIEKKITLNDSLKIIDIISVISVLLSFSVFGILFTSIFMFKYFIKLKIYQKIIMLLCCIPFFILSYKQYLSVRFSKSDENSGLAFRSEAINNYIDKIQEDIFHLLFGYSSFIDLNKVFNTDIVWNDVGFFFNLLVSFGILGVFLFVLISFKRIKTNFLSLVILCFCKLSLTTFFLWFFISFIYSTKSIRSNK